MMLIVWQHMASVQYLLSAIVFSIETHIVMSPVSCRFIFIFPNIFSVNIQLYIYNTKSQSYSFSSNLLLHCWFTNTDFEQDPCFAYLKNPLMGMECFMPSFIRRWKVKCGKLRQYQDSAISIQIIKRKNFFCLGFWIHLPVTFLSWNSKTTSDLTITYLASLIKDKSKLNQGYLQQPQI